MNTLKKLWIGLGVLIILSPIGLILPNHFKAGSAWGEWGADEIKEFVGYLPRGLGKLSRLWNAPMPDYAVMGWEEKAMPQLSFAYVLSAIMGVCAIAALTYFLGKKLAGDNE